MNFSTKLGPVLSLFCALFASVALSAPASYDVSVSFSPPTTGGAPDGYNFYVDDCAVSGALGAPAGSVPLGGEAGTTFAGLLTSIGTYEMCVRAFNAAGEQPDPGQVATVNIVENAPGVIGGFDVQITCRDTAGAVVVCADAGVDITVTIN